MNKRNIDELIDYAYDAMSVCGIARNGIVVKSYRSQFTSFGASVAMGSLKAAILFYSEEGNASVSRPDMMRAIYYILLRKRSADGQATEVEQQLLQHSDQLDNKSLYNYVRNSARPQYELKEEIMDAVVAIKLAMHLYKVVDSSERRDRSCNLTT